MATESRTWSRFRALPEGSAVALLAWENTWAIRTSMAMRRQGAVLLGSQRIPADEVDGAIDELEAMIDDETER